MSKSETYEDKEKEKLRDYSEQLTDKYKHGGLSNNNVNKFKMCATCQYFNYAETEFSIFSADCTKHEKPLSEDKPIVNCTSYNNKFIPSLYDMIGMATIIDNDKKDKIGF